MTEERRKAIANKRRSRTNIINCITKLFTPKIEEIHPFQFDKESLYVCMIIYKYKYNIG